MTSYPNQNRTGDEKMNFTNTESKIKYIIDPDWWMEKAVILSLCNKMNFTKTNCVNKTLSGQGILPSFDFEFWKVYDKQVQLREQLRAQVTKKTYDQIFPIAITIRTEHIYEFH